MVADNRIAVKQVPESDLWRAARQFRAGLERRDMRYVRRMRGAYTNALSGVMKQLAEINAEIERMETEGITPGIQTVMLQNRFRLTQDELLSAIEGFAQYGVEQTVLGQRELISYTSSNMEKTVNTALGNPERIGIEVPFTRPDTESLERFVGFASNGSPLQQVFAEVGPAARMALEQGMVGGTGPRDIARQMMKVGQGSYQRFETIARTEMIRASREVTRATFIRNDDVLEGWVRGCAGDGRTCMVCYALHGTLHGTNEIMPSHPNCRCVMIPMPKSLAEITGDPTLEDVRTKIPDSETLFKALEPDEQRDILGKTRFEKWQNGMSLKRFGTVEQDPVWGPTAVPVKLADLGD